MTLEQMKARKKELGLSNKEISIRSGVPLGTVQKIFGGITDAPRMETIIALEKVLRPAAESTDLSAAKRTGINYSELYARQTTPVYAAEPMPTYKIGPQMRHAKKQGEYTLEDYYALPDERRVELIDGVIYDMAAPSEEHQLILNELSFQLNSFVKQNHGKCRVFPAPFDVQLDMDNRTMVQPDILIICDRNKTNTRGVYGAPDLVVEILSPSTAKKDVTVKLRKYLQAGVREFWIVDPEDRIINVYKRQDDKALVQTYTFDDQVPVGIWADRCRIDFPDIAQQLDDWFGQDMDGNGNTEDQ